jgi:serine/threonine protein kinase/Tfp pilus assembly protein PilF
MPEQMVAHYRILEKIGEGGMGIVYKAEDTHLHRTVAIKFLPAELTSDPISKQRFIQEAQAASALDHPNICTIYEFNETDEGQLYMVMALYDGDSISRIIEQKTLSPQEAVDLAVQIAEGLSRAHAKGIVHRDIKSINIMVTRERLVKILDFGVAKLIGRGEKGAAGEGEEGTKPTTGTSSYMSPEQISGAVVDDRTDIWSLGVLLFEMLSGELPFQGEYAQAVYYSILNESPKELDSFHKNIPLELQKIINKSLAKDLRQRYQHILELLDDLKSLQQTFRAGAHIQPVITRKEKNRKYYIFAALSVIVLCVLVYFWLSHTFGEQADNNSITVLPFKNLSTSEESDYFSDGITEDILIQISKIRELKVISFNSSKLYKGSNKTIAEIGHELKVRYVLQGTVRRIMNDLRITAQLIDLKNDEVRWADTFERKITDVFYIQHEVADQITAVLKITPLTQKAEYHPQPETTKPDSSAQVNIHAYDYYLKGREYYYRYRNEDNDNAVLLFKEVLALDNRFTLAYAGLADAYVQRSLRYGQSSAWLDSAMQQSEQALHLDKNSAEAYKALGLIYYSRSWFQKALAANRTAVELNPNYDPALGNLGWVYYHLGKFDQAYNWLLKAVQLNPTNPNLNLGLGMVYLGLHEYKQAREYLEIAYTLQPLHQPNPLIALTMIDLMQNDLPAAAGYMERAAVKNHTDASLYLIAGDAALHAGNPNLAAGYYQQSLNIEQRGWQPFTGIATTTDLGFLLWKTAHYPEADTMFALSTQLDQQSINQGSEWWGVWYDLAAVQAIKGDSMKALDCLYHAHDRGFNLPAWLQIDPLFEKIREQDRFKQLITAMISSIETMRQNVRLGK